jgi:hypothetical protein
MALRRVLTLRKPRSGCLEGLRVPIQPSFRRDDCVQSHLWEMVRPAPVIYELRYAACRFRGCPAQEPVLGPRKARTRGPRMTI